MTYTVEWEKPARRQLRKLDPPIQARVIRAVDALGEDPRPAGAKAVVTRPGELRIRVGDWRIRYAVEDDKLVVLVLKVAHRREAYDS